MITGNMFVIEAHSKMAHTHHHYSKDHLHIRVALPESRFLKIYIFSYLFYIFRQLVVYIGGDPVLYRARI